MDSEFVKLATDRRSEDLRRPRARNVLLIAGLVIALVVSGLVIVIEPAFVSLVLAIGAAVFWSMWLERPSRRPGETALHSQKRS